MAEPSSSSSSESGEEKVDEYSNTFDDVDTPDPAALKSLSSESDSDTDIPQRSLFNIFKPGHVPGTGVSVCVHSESGIEDTDKKGISLEEVDGLSADLGDEETKDETETINDKVAIKLADQELDGHFENSDEQINQDSTEASQHAETADANPVSGQSSSKLTPLPKPVFRVIDNRKLVFDTRQEREEQNITTKEDVCDDIQIKEDSGTPGTKSPDEEVHNSNRETHINEEGNENMEVTGVTLKSAENSDPETSTVTGEGDDNIISKRAIIITDSMMVDTDDLDFKTSLTGVPSFDVLGDSDGDEMFSTPTGHLSGGENDELEELVKENTSNVKLPLDHLENHDSLSAINAKETLTNSGETSIEWLGTSMKKDEEELRPATDLSQLDQSFVVISKGSLKDSKHGYKSISSSVSESDLQNSEENLSAETDNINGDSSGSRLSFADKLKLFEGDTGDHSHQENKTRQYDRLPCNNETKEIIKQSRGGSRDMQTEQEKEETAITIAGSHHAESRNLQDEEIAEVNEVWKNAKTSSIVLSGRQHQNLEEEIENEAETVQSSVTQATDISVEKDSSYISETNETDDEVMPPVPPKSAIVMEELKSMRSLNQEADEGLKGTPDTSARNSGTSDQFGSDNSDRKQEQRENANVNNYAQQGTAHSIPYSQSQPDFPGSPWAYYQAYPTGFSPGSLPYFDAETWKRMSQDPYSAQLMYYQYYQYQQQFFRQEQGPVFERHAHSDSNLEVSNDKKGKMYHVAPKRVGGTCEASDIHAQDEARETVATHNAGPSQREQLGKTGSSTETEIRETAVEREVHPITKQQGHPVPKPRRRVTQQKPHQSLPHPEKSRTPPVKDTGISQPSTKVPETQTTQSLSQSVEVEPKTEKHQPKHFVHRQKIRPVSSAVPQPKKVDRKSREITAEKGSKNRPSLIPEKKPATRTEEVKEKPKEDTFIFVRNICPKSSTENLENFLEGGIGNEAEVKEDATLYSRDQTEALITFIGKPEMAELKKRCSQRSLDGSYLTVCEVRPPTCIAVSSDADIPSNDALTLYFELGRNGGGELATEEVLESSDASCRIIEFKSAEVVKNLCSGRHHHISDVTLKVSPYYKCELGEIWNTSLHYIPLPEPHTIQITKTQIQFLSRQCCQELKEELSHKFADMDLIDTGVTVKCKLTQRTPNCRSLARAWKSDVHKVFDSFWTKLSEKTLDVKNHVWEGVSDFLEKGELNTDTVLIGQQKEQSRILLYGFTNDVEGAYNRLSSVLNEVDRKVRRTHDTLSQKYAGRGRLLHSIGTLEEIESLFTDLNIEFDGTTLRLRGVPEDISEAKLKIHEANNEIVSGTFKHGFSSALVDFLNQIQRNNDAVHCIKKELEKVGVTAEVEITYDECLMFVPPGKQCQAVQDTIIDLIKEEEIVLEKESLPLLKEQIWDDLNEDLTERYEKTADVTLSEGDRVHIIGLSKVVDTAKEQIERFLEENTIKTDVFPIDSLSNKFIKRYSTEEVSGLQRNLSEHHVTIKIRERDVQVKGTKEGLKLAKQKLSQLFSKIRSKDHTFQKVGVTEALGNITVQLSEIETKTRCIIETPEMSGSTYLRQDPYQPEDSIGATWYGLEDEDDMGRTSSSVDEPPGFKAKNGLTINIVKGEIGKQEGSVIICATSPNLNLASGAAGKSLLREGGHTLQDECKEIIANQENIKPGEIVKIRGGKIECKYIYLTLLPNWRDDSSSLQILEDIVRDSLKMASNDNLVSVLFCALGTGGLKYPASAVASVMYSKVLEFDAANPDTSLKEVKFVLYQKDISTIQAFEKEERDIRCGKEKVSYDVTFQNTSVSLVVEQLATQKVDCILCTTNKDMNLKASGACQALLTAGGSSLQDDCKNKYGNSLPEGQVVEIASGNLKCKSVFLTTLPAYTEEETQTLKSVLKTSLGLAQAKKYKTLACVALGTGYLKYPGEVAAKSMYTAVEEFVAANPGTSLQLVKFVMHAKDIKTIEAFKAHIRRNNRVSTNRKDRKLEEGKHGRNRETNQDYNAFHDGCTIRNIKLQVIIGDILEQKTEGIVNSVNDNFEFLGGVASALKKRCPGLEKESQRKATKMRSKDIVTTDLSTHQGNLKADFIIHIVFQKSLGGWKSKFRQCLNKADKENMKSLSFPVLGTGAGQQTFQAEDIAGALFGAIDEFSAAQRSSRLQEVRLVIFHKQKYTMEPVIKSLHKSIQAALMSAQQKSSSWMSRIKDYTAKTMSDIGLFSSSSSTKRQVQHGQKDIASIKKEISSINLKIYSDDMNNIDNCIQELDRALEEEYTDYTLKDYIDLIKSLTKTEMDKLEQIECVVNMKIDQNAGIIKIQGPKKFVLDAQTELHKCLKDFERQRQWQEEAETLYQQIQWQFEEVKMDGIELVPYDKMTNLKIETAYKTKKASIELMDFTDKTIYVVDFMSLEEYIKGDKDNSATVVVRKDILKAAKQPLPSEWTAMKEDENIRITNLIASDPAYQQIEKRFVTEVTSGQYNNRISSMKNVKVTKIDRIQNKALYQQYVAKKELMTKQTPNPPAQFPIERTVWHGTSHAAVSSIQMHGFNRSYAGDKNGDPWYGHGVYFAADASYSARSWLSGANASGDGTTKGYIFLVKALTGEFCKGAKGMRFLPPKNPSNKTVLYDCAVDDVAKPMEFVIFHDAQAYPEYLITFVS